MTTAREMRQHIQGVSNIAQVTRALEAVSARKVRQAQQALFATRPYTTKAWDILQHLSRQPDRDTIHPLLYQRPSVTQILVVLITGDRGLAGAYNTNIVRFAVEHFRNSHVPVKYVAVGRKGRDMLARRKLDIIAEFSDLPAAPTFADVPAIGRIAIQEFLEPWQKARSSAEQTYIYEPSEELLVDRIVPRLTELQVFKAVQESLASEHAARMVAMRNATENANELVVALRLAYNKARQKAITLEILDIVGGAEALADA